MPHDEIPPAEKSLKYMAWNVKEMSESIKKIAHVIEGLFEHLKYTMTYPNDSPPKDKDPPF